MREECKSKLVQDTIKDLNEASKNKHVILKWTKAHIGTVGNEMADEMAKIGTTASALYRVNIPVKELKNLITDHFYKTWSKEFNNYKGVRMGKCFYHGPD